MDSNSSILTGLLAGAALGLAVLVTKQQSKIESQKKRIKEMKENETFSPQNVNELKSDADSGPIAAKKTSDAPELHKELLVRNFQFWGDKGQNQIADSYVMVIGCGGVGSHCAVALARSGVGKIKLVDFDQVTLSSLNRHGAATWKDVGTPKVRCIEKYIREFNPFCAVEAAEMLFSKENEEQLLCGGPNCSKKPDYVIDCIDNLPTKIQLIEACKKIQNSNHSSVRVRC